jgi:hypothetical protein
MLGIKGHHYFPYNLRLWPNNKQTFSRTSQINLGGNIRPEDLTMKTKI